MRTTARIKVKVIGSGEPGDPFHVDLPTYTMVPGSETFKDAEKKVPDTVEVLVPDDECDDHGKPDKAKIRAKYKGQPLWDRDDVLADI